MSTKPTKQIKEILIRMALAGAPWRETAADSMRQFDIDPEEIETEAARRRENISGSAVASVLDSLLIASGQGLQDSEVTDFSPPSASVPPIEEAHVRAYTDNALSDILNRTQPRWQTEAVINRRYAALGLEEPEIIWCEGPFQFEFFPMLLLYMAHERLDKKTRSQTLYKLSRHKPWRMTESESRFWARVEEFLDKKVDLDWFGHWLDITSFLNQDLFTKLSEQSDSQWTERDKELVKRLTLRRLADPLQRTRDLILSMRFEVQKSLFYAFAASYEETRAKVDVCQMDELHNHLARDTPKGVTAAWHIFWLTNFDYLRSLREITFDEDSTACLEDGLALFRGAFKLLSFTNVCFVCEYPITAKFNDAMRLHNSEGPAVLFPDGTPGYSWHGGFVPEEWFLKKDQMTVAEIEKEKNLEIRRILIEMYGWERYLKTPRKGSKGAGYEQVDEDECGVLYRKETGDGMEPIVAVEVVNSTPEPDGTFKRYMLRVDPRCSTARSAVAWTFGLRSSEYKPVVES